MNRALAIVGRVLLKNADCLVISVAILSWQSLTKTPLNDRVIATMLGIYLVLQMASAARTVCEPASAPEAATAKETKRVFVDDSQVILALAKLSGFEAIRRFAPYLGKWMTISGRFDGLAESLQRESIYLSLVLNDGRRINLRFGVDHKQRLHELRQGQRITAICQVQCGLVFKPENCELIRAEPLRRSDRPPLAYIA